MRYLQIDNDLRNKSKRFVLNKMYTTALALFFVVKVNMILFWECLILILNTFLTRGALKVYN